MVGGGFCVAIWLRYRLRYGAQRPATRRRDAATRVAARDTTSAHGLGAGCVAIQAATWSARPATWPAWVQCAQAGSGCAPGAPNSILTQCTVLSHCLGHCSRALFTRF